MEPAQTIIKKFGGPSALADLLGIHRTRVSAWQRSRDSDGTDGRIPQKHHDRLMKLAGEQGFVLRPADFYPRPSRARAKTPKKRAA
jgi:hypothetical protein